MFTNSSVMLALAMFPASKLVLCFRGFAWNLKHRDYEETFASTPGASASRVIISLSDATALVYELHSVTFAQAFIPAARLPEGLNGRYFVAPPGRGFN